MIDYSTSILVSNKILKNTSWIYPKVYIQVAGCVRATREVSRLLLGDQPNSPIHFYKNQNQESFFSYFGYYFM